MASTRSRASEGASSTTKTPRRRAAAAPKRARKAAPPVIGHEAIAARAFAIFESEGGGDHLDHWLRAERELVAA